VDLLRRLGLAATCNPMGAVKWPEQFVTYFVGADVVIPPDNDKPGRDHALDVARKLHLARSIKIVELPGLKPKEDVKEWLDRGGTVDALAALVADAPEFVDKPEPESPEPKPAKTTTGTDELTSLNEIDASVKAKGFPFTTYEEARTGSASPRWLLKFLLAYNERSGWVGPPGSLKSGILTALAHAVASGEDWCGKRNKGKCAVIYFALERADLVKRRLRAYADETGLVDLPVVVVGQTINFMDGNVANELIATIDEVEKRFGIKVGLLIIDTLAKAIAAGAVKLRTDGHPIGWCPCPSGKANGQCPDNVRHCPNVRAFRLYAEWRSFP
jgi:hypothetical protein